MNSEIPDKRLSRRQVLAGGVALTLVPDSAAAKRRTSEARTVPIEKGEQTYALPPFKREYASDRKKIGEYQAKLRGPDTRRALTSNAHSRAAIQVIEEHPGMHFGMIEEKTIKEIRRVTERSSVWISVENNSVLFTRTGSANEADVASYIERERRSSESGNGVLVRSGNRYFVATNRHVIAAVDSRPEVRLSADRPHDTDIGFYELSSEMLRNYGYTPADAIDLAADVPRGDDPHGLPTIYSGFDPDDGREAPHIAPTGRKEFFGITFQNGEGLVHWYIPPDLNDPRFKNSYVMMIPAGEAAYKVAPGYKEASRFINGTSGGPLYSVTPRGINFIGITWGALEIGSSENGVCYDILLFHTREQLKKALIPENTFDFSPLYVEGK